MRRMLPSLILICLALPALGTGKVTTDPNATSAVGDPLLQKTDVRLTRKVTIERIRTPVWQIIDELSKSTGVVIKAGASNNDWQVRDRRMNVFAKDVPLVQLMNSITHVMKFKWSVKGEPGKWTYRLYMDRRTLLDAEAQRARAEERQAARYARRRQKALEDYSNVSSMTDEEKAQLRNDSPFLYAVSEIGCADALRDLVREVPAVAEALAAGRTAEIEAASLAPAARDVVIRAICAELALERRLGGNPYVLPDMIDRDKFEISVNETLERVSPQIKGAFLGEIRFNCGVGSVAMPLINPESEIAKFLGRIMLQTEGQDIEEVLRQKETEIAALFTREMKVEAGGEPVIEHPDDPSLRVKVKLRPATPALYNVEMDLAMASKLCVVSDYFPSWESGGIPSQGPPSGEMELRAALDRIVDVYVYNWDKRDGVIELHDRNWFRKRAAQIPDAWIEKWRNELKRTGDLGIDGLAQIALLTYDQYNQNIREVEDCHSASLAAVVAGGRAPLAFYACLHPDQRSALFSESGLDVATLSADQSEALRKLLATRRRKLPEDVRATVNCKRGVRSGRSLYTFELRIDGRLDNQWEVHGVFPIGKPEPKPSPQPPK